MGIHDKKISGNTKQNAKKLRFTLLAAFLNYIKNSIDPDFKNPCDNQALKRLFSAGKNIQFKILEKNIVDEIIFRTQNQRNRIMLELMARGCMRISEVLNLTPMDIDDRKVIVKATKSGRDFETVFLPQKVIDRMKKYIQDNGIEPDSKIFPITYASRSGTPLDIVSKVLLRHSNLSTTQRYLGKISDSEAIRWVDNLHG